MKTFQKTEKKKTWNNNHTYMSNHANVCLSCFLLRFQSWRYSQLIWRMDSGNWTIMYIVRIWHMLLFKRAEGTMNLKNSQPALNFSLDKQVKNTKKTLPQKIKQPKNKQPPKKQRNKQGKTLTKAILYPKNLDWANICKQLDYNKKRSKRQHTFV